MPTTSTGQKYRIRYGFQQKEIVSQKGAHRYQRRTKNALVTIQQGNHVYFGIARCKLSTDIFKKKLGRELALIRAQDSFNYYATAAETSMFCLNKDGTAGYCSVRYVKTLLKHFESLDQE